MKKPRFEFMVFLVLVLLVPALLRAESPARYSFDQLWSKVSRSSPSMSAAQKELEVSQVAASRARKHWLPRLFTQARAFGTNDAALSFMSVLGQREITTNDFIPDSLNQPGNNFFEQVTLGMEFPLYEGGMKNALSASAAKTVDARDFERRATAQAHYVDLAHNYADLIIIREERVHLDRLKDSVENILSRYDIGSKANPVGYSGLLGLKNLKNRIQGMLVESDARLAAIRGQIATQAGDLPEGWTPEPVNLKEFLKTHLPVTPGAVDGEIGGAPPAVHAARSAAEAVRESQGAERARFLPQVGLFAQGDLYGGNRSASTSYTAGAFLRWELFSPGNLGTVEQAEKSTAAAEARADAAAQQARIARESSVQIVRSTDANLALMDESAKLLEEQTATANSLFRSGSINALQLVEVLSRRADLLANRAAAQLELSRATATFALNSGSGRSHGTVEK